MFTAWQLPQNVVAIQPPSATDCSLHVSVAVSSEMSAASTAAAAIASTIVATADATAVNATAAAAHNPTRHHHPSPPTLPTAIVASGDAVEAAETTSKRDAVSSVISSTAKISLRAYFEGANWPFNKALPRGAEFSCGPLGDIMREYCLEKSQVARQLLNYKKGNPIGNVYSRVCVIDTYEDLRS